MPPTSALRDRRCRCFDGFRVPKSSQSVPKGRGIHLDNVHLAGSHGLCKQLPQPRGLCAEPLAMFCPAKALAGKSCRMLGGTGKVNHWSCVSGWAGVVNQFGS